MSFIGTSALYASEQAARDNALENAVKRAISYMGIMAKSKVEDARKSYGLFNEF